MILVNVLENTRTKSIRITNKTDKLQLTIPKRFTGVGKAYYITRLKAIMQFIRFIFGK